MGRDISCHTYRNTGSSVHQKVGETAGKHGRFLLRLIEVGNKINRILADFREHLHGDLGEPGLCISHSRSAVAVH